MMTVIGLGLLASSAALGQQSTPTAPQNPSAITKPCVLVFGAVHSPARLVLDHPVRLAEAIAMAGGANARANDSVQVIHTTGSFCEQPQASSGCIDCRPGPSQPPPAINLFRLSQLLSEDQALNPYLHPGDLVLVVELVPIYVIGRVVAPRGLYLNVKITLTQAIAMVGGVLPGSNVKEIKIFRQQPGSTTQEIIVVDLSAIKRDRRRDLILQPYDIVEVSPVQAEIHLSPSDQPLPLLRIIT